MGDIEKLTNLVTQLAAAQIQTETQLSKLTEHMNNDTASNSDLIKDSPIVTGPELQAQAKELSEKYKSTTLDSDHRLHEERAGISRNDQKQLNVISKSGRCVETAFKILRSETQTNGDLSKSKVDELYTLLRAHLAYLQDEYGVSCRPLGMKTRLKYSVNCEKTLPPYPQMPSRISGRLLRLLVQCHRGN